jgi:hypothetical protein
MTAEELIIGHYEKSLTSDQESHLASMVDASPEVRTLYEQHGNIQALMIEEAETIETSSKLDKVVLGAALGTLAEIAGQGVGFSLLGKVASVVGALAVGGAGFVLYNVMDRDEVSPKANPPAVRTAPSTSGPVMPSQTTGTNAGTENTAVTETPSATETPSTASTTDARASRDAAAASRDGRSRNARGAQASESGHSATRTPPIRFDNDSDKPVINHPTEVQGDGAK